MSPNQYMLFNQYAQGPPPQNNEVLQQQQQQQHQANGNINVNTSPTFNNSYFPLSSASSSGSDGGSSISSVSSSFSSASLYSFQNPRLRYYISKSFDAEDDLEFCPEIPENFETSPHSKKFNPYTASSFLPTAIQEIYSVGGQQSPIPSPAQTPQSPRQLTPRIKKPLEIINPQTKMRVSSGAIQK